VSAASTTGEVPAAQSAPDAGPIAVYEAGPYEWEEAERIGAALELAEPVAIALVRRGYRTVEQARAFLAADECHDPELLPGAAEGAERIAAAIEAGERITVHGDYDVDGMCATAIAVAGLRRAGAECDWLIPDRSADGYGLTPATVERVAARGSRLLITVDCGITSVVEIAAARAAGLDVIVTDHHQPAAELPDCPIVHPGLGGYPHPSLCGAAVAAKLIELLERRLELPPAAERDLDLVALATVADMVPLTGENRSLARRGIAELRRGRRPGVRALAAAAGLELEHLDEGDIAFRLAPRLNAAGRLYRADAGVELLLGEDPERAAEIARELDGANHERRETERRVLAEAEATLRELPPEQRSAAGIVLAGEGWHPGVIGIVASRIAERHGRPALLIALAESRGKGSGRSVPGFDLLAALRECSGQLLRFGGHRAAAGFEVEAERVGELRAAFAAAADRAMPDGPPPARERIDAVVGAESLGTDVAEQLRALGPFGQGNPEVRLLVPWARVGDLRPMGESGRHARFHLRTAGGSARGVAFNAAGALERAGGGPCDMTVRLELNHWNGAVEPRVVLGEARALAAEVEAGDEPGSSPCGCPTGPDAGWWARFEAELELGGLPVAAATDREDPVRRSLDARGLSAVARITELLSSGERVLVLCADAPRRAALAALAADPRRFGGAHAVVCGGCPPGTLAAAADGGPALVLAEWGTLAADPGIAARFRHLVAVDPPAVEEQERAAELGGAGWLHRIWARGGDELAEGCWDREWAPRASLAEIYRALAAGELHGENLGEALCGGGRYRLRAEVAARCVRVLGELGIAQLGGSPGERSLRVLSSERTQLERSAAWRAAAARHEEGRRFLRSRRAAA
jgi:single-stranded-DNA-specific exonuclease